jgi:hypothetical protein
LEEGRDMSTVTIDAATREKLLAARGSVELQDDSGEPIGRFVKYTRVGKYIIEGEMPTDEELDRVLKDEKFVTAAAVEERLQRLKEALDGPVG